MTHVICRLTANNWDQLWNPTLRNRVWATFTFLFSSVKFCASVSRLTVLFFSFCYRSSGDKTGLGRCSSVGSQHDAARRRARPPAAADIDENLLPASGLRQTSITSPPICKTFKHDLSKLLMNSKHVNLRQSYDELGKTRVDLRKILSGSFGNRAPSDASCPVCPSVCLSVALWFPSQRGCIRH